MAAYGPASMAMADCAGRIETCRGAARRAVPLDARSLAGWSAASAGAALLEIRGELNAALRAIGTAAATLGVADVETPPDPSQEWWHRVQNCSVELGHVSRQIEGEAVMRRRMEDGQTALAAILVEISAELHRLGDLAEILATDGAPDVD